MEKSVYSCTQNPHPLPSFASADESGWTAYLEDPSHSHAYSFETSSLVSDAASHAAWKITNPVADDPAVPAMDELKIPRKLSFKPKPAEFYIDTSLEDTASSPDNSPKVSDSGPFDTNNYRRKSSLGKGKGRTMAEKYKAEERNLLQLQMGFKKKPTGYTDLKKRGLCLVPLSMFANYMA